MRMTTEMQFGFSRTRYSVKVRVKSPVMADKAECR
jgi:hypothetical protein